MELFFNIILLIFSSVFTVILILGLNNFLIGNVPFVPSHKNSIDAIIKLADLKSGDKLADLGSGDGRLLIALSKKYPNVKYTGFEINRVLVMISRLIIKIKGKSHSIKIIHGNFLKQNLSGFNFIVVYGIGRIMPELELKIKREKKDDAIKVISNTFEFPNKKPIKSIKKVRLYQL